jgi:hypothetical protein
MKALRVPGLLAFVSAALSGQIYWTNPVPDCSGVEGPVEITNSVGALVGYSCQMTGTFVWLAAGGPSSDTWSSAIRVAAPASNPIGVDYLFYDKNGNGLRLDTTHGAGTAITSGSEVNFALNADQPAEIDLLGATSNAPQNYNNTQEGTVYATFLCPDALTCRNVLPQLIYSALPSFPWSLSVPIAWDNAVWPQWSAEGVDNGGSSRVSFAIYNEGTTATSFNIKVFDGDGSLFASGTTPVIAGLPTLADGSYGEAQTFGDLLSNWVQPSLPSGVFKVLFDGGSEDSAVEVLQFTGTSATTLQVAYDSPANSPAESVRRQNARSVRLASRPRQVFTPWRK